MEYLYHRVPKNMSGTVLYPLNVLKKTHPGIYDEHVKKYSDREHLLTTEVPPLHCLWNDVLHFTAVAPQELVANLAKADIHYDPLPWFKIPVEMIEGARALLLPIAVIKVLFLILRITRYLIQKEWKFIVWCRKKQ